MFYHQRYLFTFILILLFAAGLAAQSGRRMKTPPPTPAPEISNPEPEAEKPAVKTVEPLHKLKIFSNTNRVGFSQFYFPERMSRWVTDRLQNSLLLEVSSGSDATLSEAKKIAKDTTGIFIVLVELDEDRFFTPSRSGSNTLNDNIAVKYYVLEPGTGKTKFSGQVMLYPGNLTGNNQVLNSKRLCYPQVSGNDLLLLESSIETAERIMSKFKIPIPAYKCLSKL
jgi:hypothetical protein